VQSDTELQEDYEIKPSAGNGDSRVLLSDSDDETA